MKANIFKKKNRQAGFDLLQAALVVLLIVGAASYAFDKYNNTDESRMTSNEAANLVTAAGNIKNKFATAPDFTGVTIAVLRDLDVFPSEMVGGNTVHSLFGGPIAAVPSNAAGTNDALTVTVPGYSKKACNKIAERLESNVYTLAVNGTEVKSANGVMSRQGLGAACAGGSNSISFQVTKF